jgi:ubiquinone/menaquinone biosynthesis C-methylase UbiE
MARLRTNVSELRTQEKHFDVVAESYDETIPSHVMAHLTRRRVALARSLAPSGGRALDVGCGTGTFLGALPSDRFERVGVDVSDAMLNVARARGLEVEHASSDRLPFPDGSFDLATTFAVLHHLIDPALVRATLSEMARVLRPGGAMLVWDHNPLNPYWPLLMRRLPQDQGDEKLVPAKIILDALRDAGVADLRLRRLTFMPDFTPRSAIRPVAALERCLERLPGVNRIAAHNVVTARRPA